MKKYSYLLLLFLFISMTSCLKSGLDDLPEFEENDITGVQRVEYAYISDEISPASGQKITKYVELGNTTTIDTQARTVKISVTVPAASASFPQTEHDKCAKSNISVMISISTAARVTPVGNAPKMGVAGDWSKPNKYLIIAANGAESEWTVEVTDFTK